MAFLQATYAPSWRGGRSERHKVLKPLGGSGVTRIGCSVQADPVGLPCGAASRFQASLAVRVFAGTLAAALGAAIQQLQRPHSPEAAALANAEPDCSTARRVRADELQSSQLVELDAGVVFWLCAAWHYRPLGESWDDPLPQVAATCQLQLTQTSPWASSTASRNSAPANRPSHGQWLDHWPEAPS